MRVFVLGTRGFPDIQGGVEQHCENLYPLIASEECKITVFRRSSYVKNVEKSFPNISFIDLPSTRIHGFEAFYHSFLCSAICLFRRPDIVHVHNIGPSVFTPLLKIAGLKIVMTYHSPNYEHTKWSALSQYFLKYAEFVSTRSSDKVIFVSLYQMMKLGNKKNFIHINNGVNISPVSGDDDYITKLGLQKKNYILSVGRFVEEKGFDFLIKTFIKSNHKGIRLVIAGDSDHETKYSIKLKELAIANNVVLTGYVTGEKLHQLYSHARLFILPSFNEGLPISLLEAMSYHLPVLASNIPANLQVSLTENRYFISGDEDSLRKKIDEHLAEETDSVNYDMTAYNWENIALQTKAVYDEIL